MFLPVVLIVFSGAGAAALAGAPAEGTLFFNLRAAPYELQSTQDGLAIRMESFGQTRAPGHPILPVRRVLLALPPGTRARAVELLGAQAAPLPGSFAIDAAPAVLPAAGMPRWEDAARQMREERERTRELIYASDAAVPERPVRLAATGSLRKYSYAAVDFFPFAYHPVSGRLELLQEVRLAVHYEPSADAAADPSIVQEMLEDGVADARARSLFANFDEIEHLYQPAAVQGANDPTAPPASVHDYVVITIPGLRGAVEASGFFAWKTSRGHNVRMVLTTDPEIAGQAGTSLAQRIRNFLRSYYLPWSIRYVLLVGNYSSVPMRICYPNPAYHVYNPNDPGLIGPGTPTDYYYADLSDPDAVSWDADGDGYPGEYGDDAPDFLAEIAVGRIPVTNAGRVTYTLDKIVAFEQSPDGWKRNILHAGSILFFANQDHGQVPFIDGASCLDSIEVAFMGSHTITHMSERSGLVTSLYPWPALTETSFTTAWRTGQHAIVNWSGHGWPNGVYRTVWAWDDGDGIPESGNGEIQSHRFAGLDSPNLDDDYPSVVFAISCDVGYPEPNPYGNFGIDLLTVSGWGAAVGIVSASRPAAISADWRNSPGGTEQICYDFNRCLILGGDPLGEALYNGKFDATTNYGWDRYYEYMNLYNFNLYGDPAMRMGEPVAAAEEDASTSPSGPWIVSSSPNPSAGGAALRFWVPESGRTEIAVFDMQGGRVAALLDRWQEAGEATVSWDGRDAMGRPVAAGVYLIRALHGDKTASRRLVVLR